MIFVKLTGDLQLNVSDTLYTPRHSKPLFLLLYLAQHQEWVSREKLAFLFWPDKTDQKSQQNLRSIIFRAKELPFSIGFEVESDRLRWIVDSDTKGFLEATVDKDWQAAVELYDGNFLQNIWPKREEGFLAWLEQERLVLRKAWRNAANNYAIELENNSKLDKATFVLEKLLKDEPLSEDILQRYMRNDYILGNNKNAIRAYSYFESLLKKELDLEPLEETKEIAETIRSSSRLRPKNIVKKKSITKIPLSLLRPPQIIEREKEIQEIALSKHKTILIYGDAGIGKTRLIEEVAKSALKIKCQEGMNNIPYYPIINMARVFIEKGLKTPELKQYLDDLARLMPELAPNITPGPINPETGKTRLLEALSLYFGYAFANFKDYGNSFAIDDLQWIDSYSLEFLVYLSNRQTINIFASYRSQEQFKELQDAIRGLQSADLVTLIGLEPISTQAINDLLSTLMQSKTGAPIFSKWLAKNTGGNPMFILETLKSFFESGTLEENDNSWQTAIDELTTNYSELKIPKAVSGVIARRLETLTSKTKRVLQLASVINSNFSTEAISKLIAVSEWAVIESLEEAAAAGFIRGNNFRHDLLRQSIYLLLPKESKELMHLKVAENLNSNADAGTIAEHYFQAGKPAKAAKCLIEAASRLSLKGLPQQSLDLLERAISIHTNPASSEQFKLLKATNLKALARFEESLQIIEELLDSQLNSIDKCKTYNLKVGIQVQNGDLKAASKSAKQSLELLSSFENEGLLIESKINASIVEFYLGNYQKVSEILEFLLPYLSKAIIPSIVLSGLTSLASAYDQLGRHLEALPIHEIVLKKAKDTGNRYIQVDAATNMLFSFIDLGRAEDGIAIAEEALLLGRYEGSDILRNNLVAAHADLENVTQAQKHLRQIVKDSKDPSVLCISWSKLASYETDVKQAGIMLKKALWFANQTDFIVAHAALIINADKCQNESFMQQIMPIFKNLKDDILPDYMKTPIKEIRKSLKL